MENVVTLGRMLEEIAKKNKRKEALLFEGISITYQELDENANKIANGLSGLGIRAGDRVAIMLPNIPDFVYCFYGIQKLGAVAVPFNTMYKGREIIYILNNCEAKAIITLTNFANLINEVRDDVPSLQHVILTGQRTLVFVTPESTLNVQMVMPAEKFPQEDEAFRAVGQVLVDTLKDFGVEAPPCHPSMAWRFMSSCFSSFNCWNVILTLVSMQSSSSFTCTSMYLAPYLGRAA